ncbi:ectonucleoside triphosphate diphosphohydrolase 1-like [Clytia hemisphaerica]|uniref:Ectonucleoside triphosphate diphosphohydrolase n=1 Tax=Clytia hemisphaerica TaxID=252671 RepID=A0A7M5WTD8_9CNID
MVAYKNGWKYGILIFVAIFFIVLGAVGIGVSTYFYNEEMTDEVQGRFGIVFDAGGSGTRMYIYSFDNNNQYVQTLQEDCEGDGLSKYGGRTSDLKPLLNKCLEDASTNIPKEVSTSNVPLYLKATAGMRKLREQNMTTYNNVWSAVRAILNNGSFPVKMAETMLGIKEAQYSWTTVNHLLKSTDDTSGLLEMGSTSLQVAFEPHSSNSIPSNYSEEVSLNGKSYKIYAHSYMCLGRDEFGRRYYAKLAADKFNNSATIMNPCGFQGYNVSKTYTDLFEVPCVKGDFAQELFGQSINPDLSSMNATDSFTFVGTGDFDACKQQVESMFKKNCTHSSCGTLDAYQPDLYGHFTGIGGGVYFAAEFLQLPDDFTENDFENKTKELCTTPLNEVKNRTGFGKYSYDYCLSNTYTNFVLQNLLKINKTEKGVINFARKINDQKISWTMGSIIEDTPDMSPSVMEVTRDLESTNYYVVIAISAVLLVLGLFLFSYLCFCSNNKNGSVSNRTV